MVLQLPDGVDENDSRVGLLRPAFGRFRALILAEGLLQGRAGAALLLRLPPREEFLGRRVLVLDRRRVAAQLDDVIDRDVRFSRDAELLEDLLGFYPENLESFERLRPTRLEGLEVPADRLDRLVVDSRPECLRDNLQ